MHGTALRWRAARAGNVIGGGDWAQDRLIPDILAAFEAGSRAAHSQPAMRFVPGSMCWSLCAVIFAGRTLV